MIGAIIGDIIGSSLEFKGIKTKNFTLFDDSKSLTDDSILTLAVFCALEKCNGNYADLSKYTIHEFLRWYKLYPYVTGAYGASYQNWCEECLFTGKIQPPYNSCGNGSAMRISPVAYYANSIEQCVELSRKITQVTHNHPEGIKGAEATAVAIYMALKGNNKDTISEYIQNNYYPLNKSCDEIRINYGFEALCQTTVPESIQAFIESDSYEDAIRTTISLGGDADTMGAITGPIAEAYYGIPKEIEDKIFDYADNYCHQVILKMITKRNLVRKDKNYE